MNELYTDEPLQLTTKGEDAIDALWSDADAKADTSNEFISELFKGIEEALRTPQLRVAIENYVIDFSL